MKCNHCGKEVVKYPLKGQEEKTFKENLEERTINWGNLFKIEPIHLLFLISIFLIIFGFNNYQEKCAAITEDYNELISNPYCQPIKTLPQTDRVLGTDQTQVKEYLGSLS